MHAACDELMRCARLTARPRAGTKRCRAFEMHLAWSARVFLNTPSQVWRNSGPGRPSGRIPRAQARTNGNVDAANGARMADDFEPGAADPILRGGAGVDAKLDKLLASARGWESLSLHRDHSRLPRCACGNAVHPLQRSLDGVARDVCWRCPLVAEY